MKGIKYFDDQVVVNNKFVILRLDFNVPIKDKKIQDFTRIDLCLPLINNLSKKKAKIIIISHLGRPQGKKELKFSLKPVYDYLKEKLVSKIFFYTDEINNKTKSKLSFLKEGEVVLIENIRFYQSELKDEANFAKNLASLGEIFINDAFSCSHRKQASIHNIVNFMDQKFGGPLLYKEVESINKVLDNGENPVTCIIGGSKISTKINVLNNLVEKVDNIIIIGAMANNFLKYNGINIGKSLVEDNSNEIIKKIFSNSKKGNCKIVVPEDCVISKNFDGSGTNKDLSLIKDDEMILDIGFKTVKKINDIIDKTKTILWNGPAGYFENKSFLNGTLSIAGKISENTEKKSLISVVGGGDTVSAINKSEKKYNFTHISTAGGAFLEFLEGKDLPGLNVLK